jgi:hypothetical protein
MFHEFLSLNLEQRRQNVKFQQLISNINYLNIPIHDDTLLLQYKDIISDKYKMLEHDNVIRMLKTDEYIEDELKELKSGSFGVKAMYSTYQKIALLRSLETKHNINPLDLTLSQMKDIEITSEQFTLLKTLFRTSKKVPATVDEFKQLYVTIIKHIASHDIVITERAKRDELGNRGYKYRLNEEVIKHHIKLNSLKNPEYKNYKPYFIERFNISVSKCENDGSFVDAFLDE